MINHRLKAVGASAMLAAMLLSGPITAQTAKKPMSMVDLIDIERVSDPVTSDDGSITVFVHRSSDWKQDKWIDHLWMKRVGDDAAIKLTNGKEGESSFALSPDGQYVAFTAKRGGDKGRQIYVISTSGGEAYRLTSHPTAPGSLTWMADSSGVYFTALEGTEERDKLRKKLKDDIIRFDADYAQRHLWLQSIKGGEAQRITGGDFSVEKYVPGGPDGSIIVSLAPTPMLNDLKKADLYVVKPGSEDITRLTNNDFLEGGLDLSPDGSMLLFTARASGSEGGYFNDNLFTVPTNGKRPPKMHLENSPFHMRAAQWGTSGKEIYVLANTGLADKLYRFEPGKKSMDPVFDLNQGNVRDWSYNTASGTHSMVIQSPQNPGQVYLLGKDGGNPTAVTRFNANIADRFELPRVEKVTWQGEDGVTVEGLLTYPIGYETGERYPLAVHTHGGPASSDQWGSFSTNRYTQVMAGHGYAVLQPNYRGSTGYGDAFLRDMVASNGGYFVNAHKDVMAGVDKIIDLGVADPDRLIKLGWSAGGHMTNKIITYTNRFKAASSGAGAINWFSMVGQSDIRDWRMAWFDKFPFEKGVDKELYIKNSPLFELNKVKTPTLVLVGEKDVRVPPPQSQELFNGLKKLGVPTAYYIAPGEPHGWRRLTHKLFKANIELDWFATHALDSDYVFEKPPFAKGDSEIAN